MTAQTPDLAAVVARLEQVERDNRRLRRVGVMLVLIVASGLLMGQAVPPRRTVEAERFLVRNAQGKIRAELGIFEKGVTRLRLLDTDGNARAILAVTDEGLPALAFVDRGQARLLVAADQDGTAGITLYDQAGKMWVALTTLSQRAGLLVFDQAEKRRVLLGAYRDGSPEAELTDQTGKVILRVP